MLKGAFLRHAHRSDRIRWEVEPLSSKVASFEVNCNKTVCPPGAVNLNDCPLQPYIPIYLIVSGVFSLLLVILAALPCTQGSNQLSCLCTAWNSLTTFFLFCWFIAGEFLGTVGRGRDAKTNTVTD